MRGIGSEATKENDLKQLAEAMKPLIDQAQKQGVVLLLEAINRYETSLLNSAEATMEYIVNGLGNLECVGVLWDLFHANIEDIGFDRSIEKMGKKLQHIHLTDSNRFFPGYGHTDMAVILKKVKETGYSEYASFECYNKPTLDTVLSETKNWVQTIRDL